MRLMFAKTMDALNAVIKAYIRFFIVGALSVSVLFVFYRYLVSLEISNNIAIGTTYLCGLAVSLTLNKFWTFDVKQEAVYWPVAMTGYLLSGAILIFVNDIVIANFVYVNFIEHIAFLCAALVASIFNFSISLLGASMKYPR